MGVLHTGGQTFHGTEAGTDENAAQIAETLRLGVKIADDSYQVRIGYGRSHRITQIAVGIESCIHGYRLVDRKRNDEIVDVESVVGGLEVSLTVNPVTLGKTEISLEFLRLPCSYCCRIENVDVLLVP